MDIQVSVTETEQPKLSQKEQESLVGYIKQTWKTGEDDRKDAKADWDACMKAYLCQPDPIKDKRLEWRSNMFLPWAYNAVESWVAYVHGMLIPRDEDVMTIEARTPDDEPSNEIMQKYLQYSFKNNGLAEKFGDFLKEYAVRGPAVLKVYWRKDVQTENQLVTEEVMQPDGTIATQQKRQPQELVTFNNVWFDVIPIKDFVFYPIHGDIDKTTRIHRTWRFIEDLKASAEAGEVNYFNLNLIEDEEDSLIAASYASAEEKEQKKRCSGVELKEAWIHRVKINGKLYKNVVATIANDKHLIRFQPNPYQLGRSPFIYDCMNQMPNELLGWGLLSKTLKQLNYANFLTNAKADSLKRGLYPMFKYVDDGVFNPYNVVARPHAMIKVGDLNNLVPIVDGLNEVSAAYPEIDQIKVEYDETTVPRVVRGQMETSQKTATEINAVQNNSSGKMHAIAQKINERVLKPLFETAYLLIRERAQQDPAVLQDVARVTLPSTEVIQDPETGQQQVIQKPIEMLTSELPEFMPLPEVDIKMVGYQHNLRKQEQLQAIGQTLQQLAQTPAAAEINWRESAEDVLKLQDLNPDKVLISKEEAEQRKQEAKAAQEQEQGLLIEKERQKLENERLKIELDHEYKMAMLQLEAQKLQLSQQQQMFNEVSSMAEMEDEDGADESGELSGEPSES